MATLKNRSRWLSSVFLLLACGDDATSTGDSDETGTATTGSHAHCPLGDETWTVLPSAMPIRTEYSTVLLGNGELLLSGGRSEDVVDEALLLDATTMTWSMTAPMHDAREGHASVSLPDGAALVLGGRDVLGQGLATVEQYDPVADIWYVLGDLPATVEWPRAVSIGDRIFVGRRHRGSRSVATSYRSEDGGLTWTVAATAGIETFDHLLVWNDQVVGARMANAGAQPVELYDWSSDTWQPLPPLPTDIVNGITPLSSHELLVLSEDDCIECDAGHFTFVARWQTGASQWSTQAPAPSWSWEIVPAMSVLDGWVLAKRHFDTNANVYHAESGSWCPASEFPIEFREETITPLGGGRALYVGNGTPSASAEMETLALVWSFMPTD